MALIAQEEVMPVGQARQAGFKVSKDRDGRPYWHMKARQRQDYRLVGPGSQQQVLVCADLNWFQAIANLSMVYDYTGELAPGPPR